MDDRERAAFDKGLAWLETLYPGKVRFDKDAYWAYLKRLPIWAVKAAILAAPEVCVESEGKRSWLPSAGQLGVIARRKMMERTRKRQDGPHERAEYKMTPEAKAICAAVIAGEVFPTVKADDS